MNRRLSSVTPYALLAPAFIVTLFVLGYPLLYEVVMSFRHMDLRFLDTGRFIGFKNYVMLAHDPLLWKSIINTIVITVPTVALEILGGLAIALLLNREFRGQSIVRTLLIVPMLLTPAAVALIWNFMFWTDNGMLNYLLSLAKLSGINWLGDPRVAPIAIIISEVWQETSFVFLILFAGLQALPQELPEAARVDGASWWQELTHITLPFLKPVMLVALLFRTMFTLRMFDKIFILTEGGPGNATSTLSIYLYKKFFYFFDVGYASAVAWLLVIITALIGFIYMRMMWSEVEI
ncbi:MAG TPA: sugar ABC transporter permease [Firmicutes bacterium]|nr:sugar ABC transporter permease [Bacillota bacterium]